MGIGGMALGRLRNEENFVCRQRKIVWIAVYVHRVVYYVYRYTRQREPRVIIKNSIISRGVKR